MCVCVSCVYFVGVCGYGCFCLFVVCFCVCVGYCCVVVCANCLVVVGLIILFCFVVFCFFLFFWSLCVRGCLFVCSVVFVFVCDFV